MLQQVDDLDQQGLELRNAVRPRRNALELRNRGDEIGVETTQDQESRAVNSSDGRAAREVARGAAQYAGRRDAPQQYRILLQCVEYASAPADDNRL